MEEHDFDGATESIYRLYECQQKNKDPGLAEEFRYLSSVGKGVEKKLKKFKQPVPPSFEAVQKPS